MKILPILFVSLSLFFSANTSASLVSLIDSESQPDASSEYNFSWTNSITASFENNDELLIFTTEDTFNFDQEIIFSPEQIRIYIQNINEVFNSRIETIFSNVETHVSTSRELEIQPVPLPPSIILLMTSIIGFLVFKRPVASSTI